MKNQSLDIRYACIHGFYWMICCAMTGYASVFLLDKGCSNSTIGIVLSLSNILAVFGQPIVASYMDKTNKLSLRMLVSFGFLAMIILSLILCFMTQTSLFMIALVVIVFTIMMTLQPFINSLTFVFEKHGIHINFGLARGIGSVAYAVISLILGNVVATMSPRVLPFFYVGLSLCALGFVYTFYLPGSKDEIVHDETKNDTKQLTIMEFVNKYKKFMVMLLATILLFFDHTLINSFFIQVINHIGGNSADMGNAIFLAAVLELPTMALFTKLQKKISCRYMIYIAAIFFSLKHIITYIATNMIMIYIAQIMQMFAYAVFIPASVYYVSRIVEKDDLVKGQALVTGAMTLSGVFASMAGGVLLDALGVSTVLLIGAIISVLGSVCMFFGVEEIS